MPSDSPTITRSHTITAAPLGWKIYILAWGWLGVLVGVLDENVTSALLVWAVGASAGWLLIPLIGRAGWGPVVWAVIGVIGACAAVLVLIASADLWKLLPLPATLLGVKALVRMIPGTFTPTWPSSDRWCGSCGAEEPWKRRSDGTLGCWRCGAAR